MRLLVVALIALALSGCTAPEEEQPDLIGICPHWEPGPAFEVIANSGETNVSAPLDLDGLPLDRYWIKILALEADFEMRAFANGTQRPIQNGASSVPVLRGDVDLVGETFHVSLTAPEHGTPAAPSNLTIQLQKPAQFEVTPLYRVCGL